jgi:hypothetical protein
MLANNAGAGPGGGSASARLRERCGDRDVAASPAQRRAAGEGRCEAGSSRRGYDTWRQTHTSTALASGGTQADAGGRQCSTTFDTLRAMQKIINGLLRWLIRLVAIVLPRDKAIALERWRRGREEYARFSNCDYVFASYGKAGRTWVRVMISRYYQLAYRLPETMVIDFDNFHRLNRAIPRVFFTHDNYLREYAGHPEDNRIYYDKKTVLLVRRPQDVVVSQYFQWKFRMRP